MRFLVSWKTPGYVRDPASAGDILLVAAGVEKLRPLENETPLKDVNCTL